MDGRNRSCAAAAEELCCRAPVVHGNDVFLELHVLCNEILINVHLAELVLDNRDLHA